MIDPRQQEAIFFRFAGRQRARRVKALHITAAENLHADAQLQPGQVWLDAVFFGKHIDQLDHPIAVGAAGAGKQIGFGLAVDLQRRLQRRGHVGDDIGAGAGMALITDQPRTPHAAIGQIDRHRHKRHRMRGIGHIIIMRCLGRGRGQRQAETVIQIEVYRIAGRKAVVALPSIGADGIGEHRRRIMRRRAGFEMAVQKRLHHAGAKLQAGIANEFQHAQPGAIIVHARMPPRPDHQ